MAHCTSQPWAPGVMILLSSISLNIARNLDVDVQLVSRQSLSILVFWVDFPRSVGEHVLGLNIEVRKSLIIINHKMWVTTILSSRKPPPHSLRLCHIVPFREYHIIILPSENMWGQSLLSYYQMLLATLFSLNIRRCCYVSQSPNEPIYGCYRNATKHWAQETNTTQFKY